MEPIDIKHLEHVKGMIFNGIKAEMKKEITDKYSISDQLNATGEEETTMRAEIQSILDAGHAKQQGVMDSTTFEELELVVPRKVEEEPEV